METLSRMVNIQGFNVVHAEITETHVSLSLEGKMDHGICPSCEAESHRVRVWYPRLVRDLPISGKACSLMFETRYFECPQCHVTFAEPLDFVDAKRDDTNRYETYIFDQVRQTTATYVANREGLTDTVVTRIFLRQAKARLPEQPFRGVTKRGIDEIAERKGRKAYDLIFYN